MKRRILFVIGFILIWLTSASLPGQAMTITIRSEAEIADAVVRLDNVADIAGDDGSGRLEELRTVTICSAPPPAETLLLNADTIVSALTGSGIDLSNLKLAGSAQVLVRREYDAISVEELNRMFTTHVTRRTGWPKDSFLTKPPKNLRSTPVPIGLREITVTTYPHEEFKGSIPAQFRVTIDGELYRILNHRFTIDRYTETLVTKRKIPRGRPIMPGDVEVIKKEQSIIDEDSFKHVAQVVGLLAVRTLQAGTILTPDLLNVAPVVRKGEFKSVIHSGNGFQIMTRGRLLENGASNDIVRVRLPSRKIVHAMVIDSKTLRLVRQGE
jgi:flagella basal body P-ring formation protein FlgA